MGEVGRKGRAGGEIEITLVKRRIGPRDSYLAPVCLLWPARPRESY